MLFNHCHNLIQPFFTNAFDTADFFSQLTQIKRRSFCIFHDVVVVASVDTRENVILDNLRVHHSKKVQAWLEKHKDEIEVFYLPPYAPEYNPDELVNSDLKRSVGSMASSQSEKELKHNVRSHLKSLQLCPSKISSFFNAPCTSYAA